MTIRFTLRLSVAPILFAACFSSQAQAPAAAKAARKGEKLPHGSVIISVNYTAQKDAVGNDVAGPVQSYAGMESRKDWGKDIPLLLRNENWDYALFTADGKRHDELNQAQCLACHKPRESDSYVFTLKQLRETPSLSIPQ